MGPEESPDTLRPSAQPAAPQEAQDGTADEDSQIGLIAGLAVGIPASVALVSAVLLYRKGVFNKKSFEQETDLKKDSSKQPDIPTGPPPQMAQTGYETRVTAK